MTNKAQPQIFIFGITAAPGHITHFNRYDNSHIRTPEQKSWRFEYNPMIDIIDNYTGDIGPEDYIGIFSHRFEYKSKLNIGSLNRLVNDSIMKHGEADFYGVASYQGDAKKFMAVAEKEHKGITNLIAQCCNHTGLQFKTDHKHIVYANQFITRKRIYLDYMNRIIKPSIELLEGELWPIVNRDAGYYGGLNKVELFKLSGLKFYNYLPFVLERMTIQYISNMDFKTVSLL